jgi:uncharacterized protein with von Willebrand factor type A (vWA) domain
MRHRYTAWDGAQRVALSAERAFEQLTEYLSVTDDVARAWEWLQRRGVELEGGRLPGLDELLAQLREAMRARRQQVNLDHALDAPQAQWDTLLARERAALARRGEAASEAQGAQLDGLPRHLSAALAQLRHYAFEDAEAAAAFAALFAELADIRAVEDLQRRFADQWRGPLALTYADALALLRELATLDRLEGDLVAGHLASLNLDDLGRALGDAAVQDARALQQLVIAVRQGGYLTAHGGRVQLSPKGMRRIGELALRDIFEHLRRDRAGTHAVEARGQAEVRPEETKPYEFGDPLHLDVARTVRQALTRAPHPPLSLVPADFAVYETSHTTTASTVLLLDMSWSMSWEGRFAAAKKVALAMEHLIRARYPRDYFAVVGFYTRATQLTLRDLPEVSWNMGDPFTNLQDGLRLARELLAKHPSPNQQLIVITDGQPTAYFARGRLYCEWPLSFGGISARAAQETLKEVERVTRRGIVINTFMLDDSPSLRAFVERLTRINRGRALFTRPDRLGEYLLVDYIAGKRKRV